MANKKYQRRLLINVLLQLQNWTDKSAHHITLLITELLDINESETKNAERQKRFRQKQKEKKNVRTI